MSISQHPLTEEAYQLFHDGILALGDAERTGFLIDKDYCKVQYDYLGKKIARLESKLDGYREVEIWRKLYGKKFKLDSNPQLADLLYKELKLKSKKGTSVDQEALMGLKRPFLLDLLQYRKLMKARNTYISNFISETGDDNILHPFFHLHTVQTYRSSSSDPNWQNIPVRDKETKKVVRRAIIARPGHHFVEVDYSGVEVRIAAAYHKDPTMLKYILDPTTDMHRDMAMECYKLKMNEWTGVTRYCAKNKFVFPEFYGDYYANCARNLWGAIDEMSVVTAQGVPLHDHLKKVGIGTLAKFEGHIKAVEKAFWDKRFPVYKKWKQLHIQKYYKTGYVDIKTGFRCRGSFKDNEAINYPIQGAAFHCLLWSFIRVNNILRERGKKSCIIGQVHDSLVIDVAPDELNYVLELCHQVMCLDLREHWKWINVPLEIEAEVTPIDGSWYDKEEVTKKLCSCGCEWAWERKKEEPPNRKYYHCVQCDAKTDKKEK